MCSKREREIRKDKYSVVKEELIQTKLVTDVDRQDIWQKIINVLQMENHAESAMEEIISSCQIRQKKKKNCMYTHQVNPCQAEESLLGKDTAVKLRALRTGAKVAAVSDMKSMIRQQYPKLFCGVGN